ncbi:bfr2 [Coccidioides immitis H538.4]|uniref:Protein BFR2 n=2 Tax=Coccidioides immitis TaxID=5501 RepID=A0A0J8RAT1_COCIT|nr:BFR2 protein [Coccidioides immitis RMSCC 3703]KMU83831.1 bfr2 [Coccidioides immitis H538.4]
MVGVKKKVKSLAEQIADLDDPTPKDFDPEDQNDHGQTSDDEDQISEDGEGLEISGREHYEVVGYGLSPDKLFKHLELTFCDSCRKSKLRKPLPIELGREYAGSRISRNALDASDNEDGPFGLGDSEEDLEDSDDSKISGPEDDLDDDDEKDDDSMGGSDGRGDEDEEMDSDDLEDDEEEDEEDEEQEENPSRRAAGVSDERDELRRLMASDHKAVAASISQAAKADAAKGAAVKRQRRAFDALLNSRIKLQKGVTSINSIPPDAEVDVSTHAELIKSAEAAALALWNALDDLRHTLADSRFKDSSTSSKKRKRTPIAPDTPSSEIWSRMNDLEVQFLPHRRAVLDKWSLKARGIRAALPSNQNKLLAKNSDHQTITAVLDAHIATETSANTTHPQRNGDIQAQTPSSIIYNDTAFYQSLLRDLVEQRMSSSASAGILDSQLPSRLTGLSIHPTTGMRKDKVKRAVDTKASKGRKMKYNVHEKLQNFMAPEERGSWGDRAREEFFASLLGRSAREVLGEESADEGMNGVASDDEDMEEGGLRLFRN